MEASRIESVALVTAVAGGAMLGAGSAAVGPAVGDLAILMVLFSMDSETARTGFQSVAFAGVSGFCLLSPLYFLAHTVLGASAPSDTTPGLFVGVWAVLALILFGVDRFRQSAKENVSLASSGLAGAGGRPLTTAAPPMSYRPAPIRVEAPAPAVAYPPSPAYPPAAVYPATPAAYAPPPVAYPAAPVAYPATTYPAPPVANPAAAGAAHPMFITDPPEAAPSVPAARYTSPTMEAPVFAAPAPEPPVAAVASHPEPAYDLTAIPPGREAMIYLNLVGEGLNVLRTVRAENLGRDYFRIADVMPEGEQWEFSPGMVVKCRKKSLSNGKHMVAYEEAQRAQ